MSRMVPSHLHHPQGTRRSLRRFGHVPMDHLKRWRRGVDRRRVERRRFE
ncbi:hypothetical protein M758_UG138400 [Ceratodon purpureus]|nr:hypothetical protein M758_UG138400 [Ceratodon purpureus]